MELLINSTEIYLAWEKLTQNEDNYIKDSVQKFGKGSEGNQLRAPYKDRQSGMVFPFHYKNYKESLLYKERMVRAKKTPRLGRNEKAKKKDNEEKIEKR